MESFTIRDASEGSSRNEDDAECPVIHKKDGEGFVWITGFLVSISAAV